MTITTKPPSTTFSDSRLTSWYITSWARREATTAEVAKASRLKAFGMSFTNPRPPAPSGWVGTIERSSPAMRFSSTKTRARRQSHAARSTLKMGRLTYRNHQPPNPSPPPS